MPNFPLTLEAIARLPNPADNVAIATRRIEAGEVVALPHGSQALPYTVLEGHRFAVRAIESGEPLLSWGLAFAHAVRAIAPGDYVSNETMLASLAVRQLGGAQLPTVANFRDSLEHYRLDESTLRAAPPIERVAQPRTFAGYRRPGPRGVGTRNFIVVIGTTSRTASFARQLVARLQPLARVHPTIDGIVAIAHTEGGGQHEPNNTTEILRALAGFRGVGRRFQRWGELSVTTSQGGGSFTLIDDYGHHPVEMAAVIAAARGAFPGRRLVLAFQPHRYTRTRDCFEDFVQVMGTADALLLSEVYPAGEAPIVAADGRALARALRVAGRLDPVFVDDIGRMPQAIADFVRDDDVVIAMGAGSIGGVPQKVRDLRAAAAPEPTHSASGGSR